MTYRGFHARFTIPVLLFLLLTAIMMSVDTGVYITLLALNVIVVLFTFPWDAWAVRRKVWEFPPDRVWFRVGVLPIEEVAFFVLQTLIVGLLTSLLLDAAPGPQQSTVDLSQRSMLAIGGLGFGAVVLYFLTLSFRRRTPAATYAWHLLFWFMPLIAAQWVIGYELFLTRTIVLFGSALSVGFYLTIADLVAIRHGIWYFDERQITGVKIAGVLPWEEAAFFVLTSLLVAQSMILFLPAGAR